MDLKLNMCIKKFMDLFKGKILSKYSNPDTDTTGWLMKN